MKYIADKYKVIELIDRGYRSCVYKAINIYTDDIVAVKIMDKGIITNKDFIVNLIDESTILNEINSENIISIMDIGIDNKNNLYYIASEYINGSGLDKLTKYMHLELDEKILILKQIVKALDKAHKYDIYHGDIQPHNIIVDEGLNVKINNFGIVKSNNNIFKANIKKTVVNTKYLSKNQLCLGYANKESDLYSLGLVFFELLLGWHLYDDMDEDEIINNMDKGINWISIDISEIPKEIIYILKKLLSRNNKYNNCDEIMVDIYDYIYSKTITIRNFDLNEISDVDKINKNNNRKGFKKIGKIISMIFIVVFIVTFICI